MPVHKRKPDYNAAKNMQELMDAVCAFYGEPYDDRNPKEKDVSIRDVAAKFNITDMKARKILITANLYSTSTSRKVQELAAAGRTVAEIQEIMKLGRSSVNAYLPYTNNIYNLPDVSIEAERQKQYRVRKRNKDRTDTEREEKLWSELVYLQGCVFRTSRGLDFTYKIRGGELFVDRKEKSITRATIEYSKVRNFAQGEEEWASHRDSSTMDVA